MGDSLHKVTVRAWLLAALVLFPYAAQTVHVELHCAGTAAYGHCHHDADGDGHDDGHDPATCPVCRFHLAPYIHTEPLHVTYYEVEYGYEQPRPYPAGYRAPVIRLNPQGPPARP